jgi:nucleoside-diphosphate-sugar epimerase
MLPTGQQAYRTWAVVGEGGGANFSLSLSTRPGQPDRLIRVRASGGSAQFDFGRDIYWEERTSTANPAFDAHGIASGIATQLRSLAARDRRRRIGAALRKTLEGEPFTDSMARSIDNFYATLGSQIDERHHWRFGARTIRFCEDVCDKAGVGAPSDRPVSVPLPPRALASPKVLVVGGTGFIGRALVSRLVEKGVGVRVLSRSKGAAAAALSGKPVEIVEGSHGNAEVVRSALSGIETVYHLAKCEGKKWADYVHGDIEPTRVLAAEAAQAAITRFIYTGTIDSYDSASPRKRITSGTEVDRRISSRNLYARSKAACEQILRDAQARLGLPVVILRPAIVIGSGTDPNHLGVAQFASETEVRYWGRGDNKLPLVLVDDVADALVKAMTAPGAVGRSFVLTSEPMLTAKEYVAELSARSGAKVKATARSPWRYWAADLVKELAKNLVRHPNRRWPTLHDWRCRTHRAYYDSRETRSVLGWEPVSDRDTMVKRGIHDAVNQATAG